MKNLLIRIVSGAIFVALIVMAVCTLHITPALFLTVFGLASVIGVWELNRVTREGDVNAPLLELIDMIGALAVFLAFFMLYAGTVTRSSWLLPVLLYLMIRFSAQLFLPPVNAVHSLQRSMLNVAMVTVPLGTANSLIAVTGNEMVLLAVFIFLWFNDSGAFLVGKWLGCHKMFERVSPNKTWEGFSGGMAASVAAAVVIYCCFNDIFGGFTMPVWIGAAIVTSLMGTLGDLSESLIKRTVGVKDMSNLIPGHGGLLDRIDSFLMACPAMTVYFVLLKYYF